MSPDVSIDITFKTRFRNALRWRELKIILMANMLIAILLTIVVSGGDWGKWISSFGVNLMYSYFIGMSIYFLVSTSGVTQIDSLWKKAGGMIALFVLGGWIGMSLSTLIMFLDFKMTIDYIRTYFLFTTGLAIIFGTAASSYYLLRYKFQETAVKLAEKEVNEQRLLRLKTKAELEALRSKVNPHFLFNTLNSIASLIHINPHKAEEMIQKLSDLFRYTLEMSYHDSVKLSDELNLIREYLEIEKLRLGDRLSYDIQIDDGLSEVSIPGLILQPLVENSIRHGIAPTKKGGHIRVICHQDVDQFCRIDIVDTGKGFDKSDIQEGFGLSGVRERLELCYGSNCDFQIFKEKGVRIVMRLPTHSSASVRQVDKNETNNS